MVVDMKVDKVAEDMADMVANMEAQITTTNHAICIDAIVLGRLAPFLKSESLPGSCSVSMQVSACNRTNTVELPVMGNIHGYNCESLHCCFCNIGFVTIFTK